MKGSGGNRTLRGGEIRNFDGEVIFTGIHMKVDYLWPQEGRNLPGRPLC